MGTIGSWVPLLIENYRSLKFEKEKRIKEQQQNTRRKLRTAERGRRRSGTIGWRGLRTIDKT